MKLLSRVIIVLALCLGALPLLTAPVHASATIKLSQSEGYVGDGITVSGEDFRGTIYIYYDGELQADTEVTGSCSCSSKFTVDFIVPESCQGPHSVVARDVSRTAEARFTVKPKLSLEESSGHVGDVIKAKGSGFPGEGTGVNLRYYLDTNSHSGRDSSPHVDFPVAEVDDFGSWEQTFTVPPSVKGNHTIDAYYNDSESTLSQVNNDEARLEVRPGIILNPDSGYVGAVITITGAGFAPGESDIKVRYDGSGEFAAKDADEHGSWEISFTIPPGAKGSHVIKAFNSGTAIASAIFTVVPGIFLNPVAGHVGQKFSVTGTAFDPNITVNITYQGQTVNVTTDASGNFPAVTFTATGEHGKQQITATYNGNSTPPAIFNMDDAPPAQPELISPINNERTGVFASFKGKICPEFKWLDVPDASGIARYDLQLSRSPDFTAPIASLSISENPHASDEAVAYALSEGHALPYGSYYWRVKAIDAAANEGEWSQAQSFHAGWLPRWAMFASAVALLLLIIIVSLAIRRRRGSYYD